MIELREATVMAGERALVEDVSLTVARGETLVLLGRSGSGKTTTLKLVNRLLDPSSGQVIVEGKSTIAWDPIELRRRIGYVIQDVGLFPHWTVEENVATVPRLLGWSEERRRAPRSSSREVSASARATPTRWPPILPSC
jgi:osmoprotectant transport system ATP-binding protein